MIDLPPPPTIHKPTGTGPSVSPSLRPSVPPWDPRRSLFARALARAHTPPPDVPLWQWADENVTIQGEDSAQPGPYRSSKTPWTRRLQDLVRRPEMWVWQYDPDGQTGRYVKTTVHEVSIQKSSQSGFTEACLNGVRWKATWRPANIIYQIDSADNGRKLARRLLRSFQWLDQDIFTGDADDIKSLEFVLRGMEMHFVGSFSEGKATQIQASLLISDEIEEHGNPMALRHLASRKKQAGGGIQINLSKPKKKNGPINKAFRRGNQEYYHLPCPHCGHLQYLTLFPDERETPYSEDFLVLQSGTGVPPVNDGTVVTPDSTAVTPDSTAVTGPLEWQKYTAAEMRAAMLSAHPPTENPDVIILPIPLPRGQSRTLRTGRLNPERCRDLLGDWDRLRMLEQIFYTCGFAGCEKEITESQKQWMLSRGAPIPIGGEDPDGKLWLGEPGVVSIHHNDLYQPVLDPAAEENSWGRIYLGYLDARKAGRTADGKNPLEIFYNHRLGLAWEEEAAKLDKADLESNLCGRTLYFVDSLTGKGHDRRQVYKVKEAAQEAFDKTTPALRIGDGIIESYCPPYRKGLIPWQNPQGITLGVDVGGTYIKWAVVALAPNKRDMALIDWGRALGPVDIYGLYTRLWKPIPSGTPQSGTGVPPVGASPGPEDTDHPGWHIGAGFFDTRYDTEEMYKILLRLGKRRATAVFGGGGESTRNVHLWDLRYVPEYDDKIEKLIIVDRHAKNAFYLDRLKHKKHRIWFPLDLFEKEPDGTGRLKHDELITECTNEQLLDNEDGTTSWKTTGPNHLGDAIKYAVTGTRFRTRKEQT